MLITDLITASVTVYRTTDSMFGELTHLLVDGDESVEDIFTPSGIVSGDLLRRRVSAGLEAM